MKVAVFSTKPYDEHFLKEANSSHEHDFTFFEPRLTPATAPLAHKYDAVCAFVNDQLNATTLEILAASGVRCIALRCAGFNNVDLQTAQELELTILRVPAYSPHAVAEHAVGLMLALNRHIHRAYNRVREANFSLSGLLGFDMHGKTAGIIGTGKIGVLVIRLLRAFGMKVVAFDPYPNEAATEAGAEYVALDDLFSQADVISLHCPLTRDTMHLINEANIAKMKHQAMLINTSRGKLVDSRAVIQGLKTGQIGYLGLDVYEEEEETFFQDHSLGGLQDDTLARLITFPNVIITGHQAFFTENALKNIAQTTMQNLTAFERGEPLENEVKK